MSDQRLQFVIDTLASNPALTKYHFIRNVGISKPTLEKWESDGLVKFAKPDAKNNRWRQFTIKK